MAQVPLGLRLDEDLLGRIDVARKDVPRARWIARACEAALGAPSVDRLVGRLEERGILDPLPAPAEQPGKALDEARTLAGLRRPAEQSYRSSGHAKRDVRPVPKKGA